MRYLKIFDRFHNIIDEITEYSGLKYTWTLNGLGKCQFDVPLESQKCTPENFNFLNHIEIWDETNNKCCWGGVLVDRNFQTPKLSISCFGYLFLLKQRRFRAKTYPELTYAALFQQMIADTNIISPTGVTIGNIQAGSLKTQRKVEDKDYLLDMIQEYINDCNNDIEVDNNRLFNFYLRKGKDKSFYTLEYGGDADNILTDPGLSQSVQNLANSIYSESDNDVTVLTSLGQDTTSINLYGLVEGSYSANSGIVNQSTLDNYVQGELQRRAYATNAVSLNAKDSSLCPFEDIEVGDSITVSLKPYWEYKELLRVLEMTHNEEAGERDIVVGQTLYRPQPPKIKLYRK
jgi:hypothetical protein